MVVYYSKSGATRRCAKALSEEKGDALFELKAKSGGMLSGVIKNILRMKTRVETLPELANESTVYICSPVWAGSFTPAIRYFINNSDLNGKTVKLLLTCMTHSDTYAATCEKELAKLGISLAGSLVLSPRPGEEIDKNIIRGL